MKVFTLALVATATSAFQLQDWSKSYTELLVDNRIGLTYGASTECYWGLRQPVQWALYEDYHEAVSMASELYSNFYASAYAGATLNNGSGVALFGLTLTPKILFWDIAFLENLLYVWPPSELYDRDGWDMCTYQGWWFKTGRFYVDISATTRECVVGTYDFLIDSGSYGCAPASYTVNKAVAMKIPNYAFKEEGMFGWGPNGCADNDKFDRHEAKEGSFLDSVPDVDMPNTDGLTDALDDAANSVTDVVDDVNKESPGAPSDDTDADADVTEDDGADEEAAQTITAVPTAKPDYTKTETPESAPSFNSGTDQSTDADSTSDADAAAL